MAVAEFVPNTDLVSRQIWEPRMFSAESNRYYYDFVFEFPKGQGESVFWHRHISLDNVHVIGCERQDRLMENGKNSKYAGAITGCVENIRGHKNSNGHGFDIVHEPSEGQAHCHLIYDPSPKTPLTRQDKIDLRLALGIIFSTKNRHLCK